MNRDFISSQISRLSSIQLAELVKDAEYRIGSNVAGGSPNEIYINKQRGIIEAVEIELSSRK
ncbi:hypothetical protein [Peribacillus loiseleuriae]|uniref:hypothetical protein n=1 Tax=Peribacillus loiseleuriae TaxID=1679170 RepID=UPI003CFF173C